MNHLFDVDSWVSQQYQRRMHVAIAQQGFRGLGAQKPREGWDRRAVSNLVAGAIGVVTGITGYIAGLVTSQPHASVDVTKLRAAVSTLYHQTSAILRTEALLKDKLQDTDQGLGATRRGTLANAATISPCEGSQEMVVGLRKVRRGRALLVCFTIPLKW